MLSPRRLLLLALLVWLLAPLTAHAQAPRMDKIDPPNWWINMPSPMLLVRGENLSNANFSASPHTAVTGTQVSANGHWAFVWLDTRAAQAGEITLSAHNPQGTASVRYALAKRRSPADGFAGFSAADVLYLIMPDRFANGDPANDTPSGFPEAADRSKPRAYHGGDLRGIEQHLDYLKELGVTAIWTTPLYDNSAAGRGDSYHGYSATDLYAVDPHFGTLADYQRLVSAAHARGIKVLLDTVPNHIGPAHPWVNDPPLPDWFHGTAAAHFPAQSDYDTIIDPHAAEPERAPTQHGWFANVLPDMDTENPLVAQYLTQNALWWTESAGLDGLRLDTFAYVNRSFWQQFHRTLHALYPNLRTVGEIFTADPTQVAYFAGGATREGIDTGLDTPFDFPMRAAILDVLLHNAPATRLSATLARDWLYPHPERLVPFFDNHDTARFMNDGAATPEKLRAAYGLLATLRGMPQIYAGDEVAMQGGSDPDNRRDFPGGFPGDTQNAFTAAGRTSEQAFIHDWVAQIFTLRGQHPALTRGSQQDIFADDKSFVYARSDAGNEMLLIAFNETDQRTLSVNLNGTIAQHQNACAFPTLTQIFAVIPTGEAGLQAQDGVVLLNLPPWQLSIYRADWACVNR